MKTDTVTAGFRTVRRDQLRQEHEHDAYRRQHKPAEPCCCPGCGAIYHAGRWQWGLRRADSSEVVCPACQRIRDHFPAGFLVIRGDFFARHREDLLGLIQHHAEKARAEHPLSRIMSIREEHVGEAKEILVTTTDIHLARDLGEALHHAYQGSLEFHYNDEQQLLRVHWER